MGHCVVLQVDDLLPEEGDDMKRLFQRALRQTCRRCLRGVAWRLETCTRKRLKLQVHLADLTEFRDSCALYI